VLPYLTNFLFPSPISEGVSPQLLNFNSLDELHDMESDLWDELREANEELRMARQYAIEFDDDEESLIATGLEPKNSDDDGGVEESISSEIPNATMQVFTSSEKGLRSRCTASSCIDQWGTLHRMNVLVFCTNKDPSNSFHCSPQNWHRRPLQKCVSFRILAMDLISRHVFIALYLVLENNSKSCLVLWQVPERLS
jgi:hypothetical protein